MKTISFKTAERMVKDETIPLLNLFDRLFFELMSYVQSRYGYVMRIYTVLYTMQTALVGYHSLLRNFIFNLTVQLTHFLERMRVNGEKKIKSLLSNTLLTAIRLQLSLRKAAFTCFSIPEENYEGVMPID